MLTIYHILKDINNQPEKCRLNFASEKYSKFFNEDIIKYFLTRHCSQYSLFKEFDNINIENTLTKLITVSTDDIFNKLEYANFCTSKDETIEKYNILKCYTNHYWPHGSWSAPIIVIERDTKLIVVDGNNRLRMLRLFLRNSEEKKANEHKLYVIQENSQ